MNTHESFFRSAFRLLFVCLVLLLSFWVGYGAAWALDRARQYGGFHPGLDGGGYLPASGPSGDSWGLSFPSPGAPPVGNATADELREYNAYYTAPTEEKVIYLTFDAGYENGCTAPILDTLKKHQVPAAFFVVGHFLETSPELVKRMVNEGHTVANHTFHHPDMSKISSLEAFQSELSQTEALYERITGQQTHEEKDDRNQHQKGKYRNDATFEYVFWQINQILSIEIKTWSKLIGDKCGSGERLYALPVSVLSI